MTSDVWLFFAIFCFVLEVVVRGVSLRRPPDAENYGGILLPLGLAFFAISFLSMVTRAA